MWSKNFRSRRSPVELAARTHNRRRERDPLGQGQPCTWRTRLVKVAALVYESTRRVVVRLSSSWPYLGHYHHITKSASESWRSTGLRWTPANTQATRTLHASATGPLLGEKGAVCSPPTASSKPNTNRTPSRQQLTICE